MSKVYYLFSRAKQLEAVYACDGGDYIDAPIVQTGVYPMGTLLSKALRILSPWAKSNFSPLFSDNVLSNFSIQHSSFSNIVCDDDSARVIMKMLLAYDTKRLTLLKSYMDYIFVCKGTREYCSVDKLFIFSNSKNTSCLHVRYKLLMKRKRMTL